ncbi:MAG: hypothetical protein ACE5NA_11810, partial [Nitrospiraceae bacterium]
MLATTAYDAPTPGYTYAMSRSREMLHQAGIQTEYVLLSGNCHVDDARNVVVKEFLESRCEDLVFIDADVSWEPKDLLRLCQYDCDLVGAIYPFRREGANRGDRMPVRLIEGVLDPDENDLLEVEAVPTGFMRIRRQVLESLAKDADHFYHRQDTRSKVPILFQRTFSDDTRWGGDVHFCNLWRATGGKICAASEIRLGHSATSVIYDSLAAWMRRHKGETLRHMVAQIRAGHVKPELFSEARHYVGNDAYVALEDVLSLCALVKSDGPIIEAGSGLTTIILAAANPDQTVYCLEHHPIWAMKLKQLAHEAGTFNIALCRQPIRNGWYDLSDLAELPERFGLGVNDGPPRALGSRMGFFTHFGDRVDSIICDDADDPGYRTVLYGWAQDHGRLIELVGERATLMRREQA